MNKGKLYRRFYAPAEPLTDSFAPIHSEEAEAKTRAEALHPCTTYRADVELLRKGIIKKVGDEDGRESEQLKKPEDIASRRIYDRILEQCHPLKIDGESMRRKKLREDFGYIEAMLKGEKQ